MSYPPSTYGPPAELSALIYETVERAGCAGCTMDELLLATGRVPDQLFGVLGNLRGRKNRRTMIYSLPVHGKRVRYFLATVPHAAALALVQREGAELAAQQKVKSRLLELARKARHREKARALKATAKATAKAEREAERARLAEIAAAAARVRKLDALAQSAARAKPLQALKRGEHALSNAVAKRIRADGTHGKPPAAKPAPTVTWPAGLQVQRVPRAPDRWAVQQVQPVFSAMRIGQYLEAAA